MKKLIQKGLIILSLPMVLCACGDSKSKESKVSEFSSTKSIPEENNYFGKTGKDENVSSEEPYQVSSGYTSDPNFRPTVSDEGDYHTIDGKRRQIQYQGSQEQQRDLDMIDEYIRNNPGY